MIKNSLKKYRTQLPVAIFVVGSTLVGCGGGNSAVSEEQVEEAAPSQATLSPAEPAVGAALSGIETSTTTTPAIENTELLPDVNNAPQIVSMSMGCDLILESVSIAIGETAEFNLVIEDESPNTLSYSAIADDSEMLSVSVSESGVYTMLAISEGVTTVPIEVTDDAGNNDIVLLNVIVES